MSLPNGIMESYSYDQASQVTGIRYQVAGNTLGNLTYSYDVAGRRTQVAGSFARTGIPLPVSTTAYNAANELTQWGTANLFYDADGNTTSDGTNSFTWDARNQLASMNAGIDTFQYDPFGRRVAKTISGATTNYLYDGVNPVQELSAGIATANLLTGPARGEFLTRTDPAGQANLLTDGSGSTLALGDPTSAIQTQYTYEPFGNTTTSGQPNANPYQYHGDQNDGDGYHWDGDRYYNPTLQRHASQRSVVPRPDWRNPYTDQPNPGGGSAYRAANSSTSPLAGRKPEDALRRLLSSVPLLGLVPGRPPWDPLRQALRAAADRAGRTPFRPSPGPSLSPEGGPPPDLNFPNKELVRQLELAAKALHGITTEILGREIVVPIVVEPPSGFCAAAPVPCGGGAPPIT